MLYLSSSQISRDPGNRMLGAGAASLLSRPDTTSFSFRGEFQLVCFTFTYFPSAESTGKLNLKGLAKWLL